MDEKKIRYLGRLACIKLTNREVEGLKDDLGRLLEYVGQLDAVAVDEVVPTSAITPDTNRFREDAPAASLPVGAVLAGAPEKNGDFIRVPTVIRKGKTP